MRVSSFCGCCSLKAGTLIITILHIIAPALLIYYLGAPSSGRQYCSGFYSILVCCSVMLLFGLIKENADCVFPFVCIHFIIVTVLTYYIVGTLIHSSLLFRSKPETIIAVCAILFLFVTHYFFTVVYNFYQELLYKKFSNLLSKDKNFMTNEISNSDSTQNASMQWQTKENKITEDVIVQLCSDTKKPVI